MKATLPILEDTRHKVTVEELNGLARGGFFDDPGRIELIEGIIVDMPDEGFDHADAKMAIGEWLMKLRPARYRVMIDTTLLLPPHEAPSPDMWVYPRDIALKDLKGADVAPIIEIADDSLRKDREVKAPLYARFGAQEYLMIDLETRNTLVFRPAGDGKFGEPAKCGPHAVLHCGALPGLTFRLEDLPLAG